MLFTQESPAEPPPELQPFFFPPCAPGASMPEIQFSLAPEAQAPIKLNSWLRLGRKLAPKKIHCCACGACPNQKYFAFAPEAQACLKNILNERP